MSFSRSLRSFFELVRFSHTLFALPFALLAAVLAWWQNAQEGIAWRGQQLAGILLCMVFGRTTAMAFNRLADRRLDAENPRTAARHLPRRMLSLSAVWTLTTLSTAGFVLSTLWFLPNPWPIRLAIPVLLFVCGYSFTKRFTMLSHFWLGASLMLAPMAAWIAVRGQAGQWPLAWPPVLLGAAVLFWVAGFDIIYACQDIAFDRRAGLKSIPARLGAAGALRVAAACHAVMVLWLIALPLAFPLGWIYDLGVAAIAGLLIYEHLLVCPEDLQRVNVAFFHVNSIISVGLLVVGVADLLL
ncbi:MAG: UbiA family prenyltransferase [Planctomycetes bacterium]|nr:UbiA family prenyltransferase [Planctomycetota bacterium]